jgi:hypothetical protein
MGLDGGWTATDAEKLAINADPRMKDVTVASHDIWTANGGDLVVYYCAVGPTNWEFTPAVANAASPKLQAIDKLRDTLSRVDATLGGIAPCTVVARTMRASGTAASVGTFWNSTIATEDVVSGIDAGEWVALPVSTRAPGWYKVVARGCASGATATADLWVNGVKVATCPLTGNSTTLMNTIPVTVQLARGLNVLRFQPTAGQASLRSFTLEVDTTVSVGPRVVAGLSTRGLTLRSSRGLVVARLTGLPAAASHYVVYSISGRLVASGQLSADANGLVLPASASGTYVLRVQAAGCAAQEQLFGM